MNKKNLKIFGVVAVLFALAGCDSNDSYFVKNCVSTCIEACVAEGAPRSYCKSYCKPACREMEKEMAGH